jgi:CheY-like chemotaxis protein
MLRKEGPLVLVEDDIDDQELIILTLRELGLLNEIKLFQNGQEALEYLYQANTQPFLILSDINMPILDGIAFKKKIDSCAILKTKCIPFVFISTSPAASMNEICKLNIQGFFEKGNSMRQLNEILGTILKYWNLTKHLN